MIGIKVPHASRICSGQNADANRYKDEDFRKKLPPNKQSLIAIMT